MSDSGNDLFNAVQDWVAHELRGERPSSIDYPPGVAREPGLPGPGSQWGPYGHRLDFNVRLVSHIACMSL